MPSSRVVRSLSVLSLLLLAGACRSTDPTATTTSATATATASASLSASAVVAVAAPAPSPTQPPAPPECPEGTRLVPGGLFWMGQEHSLPEEAPRHRVAVRSFCMDTTEVTTAAYRSCQEQGRCKPAHTGFLCTIARPELSEHPINCVDWHQARAYCEQAGGRLPTEREWEYAARAGAEQRVYSWGGEPPDGRCCYSHPGTCKVGSYPPGPFGLLDLTGNVWEWTATAFGPYPGELLEGPLRVYRGGSFSRRFPKWMRNGLRNRFRAEEQGAHLGFRCARDLPGAACPEGSSATRGGGCQPEGVPEPSPPVSLVPRAAGSAPPRAAASPSEPVPLTTTRDPRFDSDCAKNKPGRPVAYLVKGGSFADRQRSKGACSNRDVGLDFNSVCCAQ